MSLSRSQRFLGYGLAGWCSEVVTTGLRSRGREGNWRLTGHTYLWMLPVYGVAAVAFEPAYAPVWFAVGLGMEQLHDLFDRVEVRRR